VATAIISRTAGLACYGVSGRFSAAQTGAQTTTGGVAVVADSSAIGSSSHRTAAWITARTRQDLPDAP